MRRFRFPLALTVLTATICAGCGPQPVTSGPAPDFTLDSLDGDAVTLSALAGQVVAIDFWATWCSPCVEGLDHLQQIHERYADQGLAVLAINVGEDREEAAEFVADHGYTFTVLLDVDGRASDAYGVQAIPHTLIVDREGEVHYTPGFPDEIEDTLGRLLME
jgi:cytochrome c biogenesis protein CcmG/thiol:disulfide interchange protein DsbE